MHRNRTWLLDPIELRTQRNRILPIEGGDGSTLSLDFTTGVLDPRLTFTRASNATFINSSGLVQWAANNMVIRSQDYTNSAWSKLRIDTTSSGLNVANTTLAPDGSNTGLLLKADAANGTHRVLQSNSTTGSTFLNNNGFTIITLSAFFKANGSNFAALKISNNIESRGVTRTFNLTNGVVSGIEDATWVCTNASATSVGNGWYRCQITASISRVDANDDQLGMWLFVANGADTVDRSFTNSSASVWAWGAQAELESSAGGYNATTTATYQAPRFDHDPTSIGTPRGLLIEGSANNVITNSNALTSSGWSQIGIASTTQSVSIDAPSGLKEAWIVEESTASGYHVRRFSATTTAAAWTFSFWAKAKEHDRVCLGDQSNGRVCATFVLTGDGTAAVVAGAGSPTNPTIVRHQNGWYRCSVTATMTAVTSGIGVGGYPTSGTAFDGFGVTFTGTSGNGVYLYGFQAELGSGASSYIPTGASTGTRLADSVVMNDIAPLNYSATNGSIYWSGIINKQPTSYITLIGFMTAIDQPAYETFGNGLNYFTAARGATLNGGGANEVSRLYVLGSLIKYASSVNTLQDPIVAVNLNGSAGSNNKSGTGDLRVATRFVIGRQPSNIYGTEYPSVTIRSIKYWPTSKVAAELAALTA